MRRIHVFALALVIGTAACSSFDFGEAVQGLQTTYKLGNSNTIVGTTSSPIQTMWQDALQLPDGPFKPSVGSGFKQTWYVDNGGYRLSNGQGNLNMLLFRINLVQATPTVPAYWAATADMWKADATGHTTFTANLLTVTAWPSWEMILNWQDGYLVFDVFDAIGRLEMEQTYPLTFPAGPGMTNIRSPEVDFTIDSGSLGCKNDILAAADTAPGTGYYYVETWAGPTVATQIQAVVAAPRTNAKCSMRTTTYPGDNDTVNWTVGS